MIKGYIYSIYSESMDIVYIGSTVSTIDNRFRQHLNELLNNTHINWKLQEIYNEQGVNDLIFTQELELELPIYQNLIDIEHNWISIFPEDYCINLNRNPHKSPMYGIKQSKESNLKRSIAFKGENNHRFGISPSIVTRNKIRKSLIGKPSGNLGNKHTPDAIEKNRQWHLGKNPVNKGKQQIQTQGENNPNSKLVWEQIKNIRLDYWANGFNYSELAAINHVHKSTIRDIVLGNIWKDIEYSEFING